MKQLIVILGATATGKTKLAVNLAREIDGEIISADSRQVYRGMDIGTGKDLSEYGDVKYHLIDIAAAGDQYNIFNYKLSFEEVLQQINERDKFPIVCGGSGMYLEVALGLYNMNEAPIDNRFRLEADNMSDSELISHLEALKEVHNVTDLKDRERLIRAIEIAREETKRSGLYDNEPCTHFIYGVDTSRQEIRDRITKRLKSRLEEGLIEEVEELHSTGISFESLRYYGLEYKYVSMYLQGELNYDEMFRLLNTAIHQFAKRQMTWFRRMERRGVKIKWLPADSGIFTSTIVSDIESCGIDY
jgi:tRNA dimethylallyltransferase